MTKQTKIEKIEFAPKETIDDRLWKIMVCFNNAVDAFNFLLIKHNAETLSPEMEKRTEEIVRSFPEDEKKEEKVCVGHGGATDERDPRMGSGGRGEIQINGVNLTFEEAGRLGLNVLPSPREEWEEKFDSKFIQQFDKTYCNKEGYYQNAEDFKIFIRKLLSQAVEEERARIREGVKSVRNIGYAGGWILGRKDVENLLDKPIKE